MGRARKKPAREVKRVKVNVTLDAVTARRLKAFCAWNGRTVSDVVAEAVRAATRGFTASQEGPRLAEAEQTAPGPATRQDAA